MTDISRQTPRSNHAISFVEETQDISLSNRQSTAGSLATFKHHVMMALAKFRTDEAVARVQLNALMTE